MQPPELGSPWLCRTITWQIIIIYVYICSILGETIPSEDSKPAAQEENMEIDQNGGKVISFNPRL